MATFKVLLVDQRKTIRRLLSLVITYLVVTPLCLSVIANLNSPKSIFTSIIIAFLVAFPVVLYLILKSTNSKETILLNEQFISTNAFGPIEFKNIRSIKLKSYNTGIWCRINAKLRIQNHHIAIQSIFKLIC